MASWLVIDMIWRNEPNGSSRIPQTISFSASLIWGPPTNPSSKLLLFRSVCCLQPWCWSQFHGISLVTSLSFSAEMMLPAFAPNFALQLPFLGGWEWIKNYTLTCCPSASSGLQPKWQHCYSLSLASCYSCYGILQQSAFRLHSFGAPPPTPAASYCFSEVCVVSSHDAGHSFMALVWSHLSAFQLKWCCQHLRQTLPSCDFVAHQIGLDTFCTLLYVGGTVLGKPNFYLSFRKVPTTCRGPSI